MIPTRFYVYVLTDQNTKAFYVGKGCRDRTRQHAKDARKGRQSKLCNKIRSLWTKGETFFAQKIATYATEAEAYQRETEEIARYGRHNLCNIDPGGIVPGRAHKGHAGNTNAKGSGKRTEEQKARIKAATRAYHESMKLLGVKQVHSAATREKISKGLVGKFANRTFSAETRLKISLAHKGNTYNLGKKLTQEHRDRIGLALRGRTLTPEHIAKTKAGLMGRKNTPEQMERLRAAHMGKSWSPARRLAYNKPTHCKRGHLFDESTKRHCRVCKRERGKQQRSSNRPLTLDQIQARP